MKTNHQEMKQSKNVESFFLDTNIIIGRAFESEREHLKCKFILASRNTKYSSTTVENEVLNLLERRKKYYQDILILKYNLKKERKTLSEKKKIITNFINKIALNKNDRYFLKKTLNEILARYWNKGGIEYYRTLLEYRERILLKCLKDEIQNPLIGQTMNKKAIKSANLLINNMNDSQVLLDMIIEFLPSKKEINFTTMDKKDLLNKGVKIKNWFIDYFKCDCFFEILGVSETIKRINK